MVQKVWICKQCQSHHIKASETTSGVSSSKYAQGILQDCPDIGSVSLKSWLLTEILVHMHGVGLVCSPLMEMLEWGKK